MKKFLVLFLLSFSLTYCNDKGDKPNVSGIKVDVPFERFEESFFSIDSNNIQQGLATLNAKHAEFYPLFMNEILGVNGRPTDTATVLVTRRFLTSYKPIYDSIKDKYRDVSDVKKELEHALRYVKHYYPSYKTGRAITFIAPFDMPGTALVPQGIAIGLHQYAGKNFSVYHSTVGQQLYPEYISRRFDREYIVPNCMRAVVEDMYPDKSGNQGLIIQMVEKGKHLWLVDKFLPDAHDSLITGFTGNHILFAEKNEGLIWQQIITDEKDLFTVDPQAIQMYMGEAPYTLNMGQNSPGNIGPWVGWQIVKKYVDKNPDITPDQLMRTDPRTIFGEARYKPK